MVTCSDTRTITTGSPVSICGHLVQIYDIRAMYSTIDVLVDGYMVPGVGTVDKAMDGDRVLITLISKNVSAGTAVIVFSTEPNIPPPTPTATHHFDIYLQPYSWYSSGQVADYLISKGTSLTGFIANTFSGITGWQYVSTDIVPDNPNSGLVTIRINLNQIGGMGTGIQSLALPAVIAAIEGILMIGLLIIIIAVAVIVGYELIRYISNVVDAMKQYTKGDVAGMIWDKVVPDQIAECKKNFTDPIQQTNCIKSAACGAANGTNDALKLTGADCGSLKINEKIDACTTQYQIDHDLTKYQNCVNGVVKDAGTETKNKTPKDGMGLGIILLGLGLLGVVFLGRPKEQVYIRG